MGQLDTSYTPAKQATPKPTPTQATTAKPVPSTEPVITDYASI